MKVYVLHEFVFDDGSEDFGVWVFNSCNDAISFMNTRVRRLRGYYNIDEHEEDYTFDVSNTSYECWMEGCWSEFHMKLVVLEKDVR